MPTIRQLIQTTPAKANELFAKLVETSGSAVKTRERLFSELKEELDLQMRLEEQHLFPVLRKRKETKDLVPDALNDNKETRKALTELERTPRVGNVVRVSAEAPRRAAETAREAVQSGVGIAAQMAQRAADFGFFSDVTRRWQNAAASMTAV